MKKLFIITILMAITTAVHAEYRNVFVELGYQPAHVDVIDDGTSENIHVERLHDVGICSCLQTLQLVLVPVLGSQQDDGDMIRHRIHL